MKKLLLIIAFALITSLSRSQIVNIPDANFKAELIALGIDINKDKEIQVSEAIIRKSLDLGISKNITDLTGIEFFTSLTYLRCRYNKLTTLDLSKNTALVNLYCEGNKLTSLVINKNLSLKFLDCYDNELTSLDVSKNTALEELNCYNNQLTSLDVSKNTALEELGCSNNKLTELDVSNNINLTGLYCRYNQIKVLDVTKNTALYNLQFSNNQLTEIDLSKNYALYYLFCQSNQLIRLDVSMLVNLSQLYCWYNYNLKIVCINSKQLNNIPSWDIPSTAQVSTTCTITSIEENDIYTQNNKSIVHVVTPLGQEIRPEQAKSGMYIYYYSDGTKRKIMK